MKTCIECKKLLNIQDYEENIEYRTALANNHLLVHENRDHNFQWIYRCGKCLKAYIKQEENAYIEEDFDGDVYVYDWEEENVEDSKEIDELLSVDEEAVNQSIPQHML